MTCSAQSVPVGIEQYRFVGNSAGHSHHFGIKDNGAGLAGFSKPYCDRLVNSAMDTFASPRISTVPLKTPPSSDLEKRGWGASHQGFFSSSTCFFCAWRGPVAAKRSAIVASEWTRIGRVLLMKLEEHFLV